MEKKKRIGVQDFFESSNPDQLLNQNDYPNSNQNFKNDNSIFKPNPNSDNYHNNNRFDNNNRKFHNKPYNNYNERRSDQNNERPYQNRYEGRNNRNFNNHYSNNYNSSSSGNYYRGGNFNNRNNDLNDIKFDVNKVFPNLDDKVLREIILYQKITLEEIINFLFLSYETQKYSKGSETSANNLSLLSSIKYLNENEKHEHKEYILKYKVDNNSQNSRRALKINNSNNSVIFNYIPVQCKKDHHDEKEFVDCIYSHNNLEIDYHFLKFKLFFCREKDCSRKDCPHSHGSSDFRALWNIPVFLKNKNKNDLIKLKRTILESKFFKNVIISHFETMLPQEFDLNTYKVYKCPLGENCFVDYHLCLNYHDPRERRRDPIFYKIEKNEYCPHIRAEGRLLDPEKCKNRDFCEFLHTKNELNYDVRNFRRITDCQRNKKRKCEFFDVCYGKHYNEKGKQVDNSISNVTEEINILQKQKEELLLNLQNNNEKMLVYEKEIKKIEKDISQLRCNNQNCPNPYNLAIRILNCKHYYCDPCFKEILETKICLKCHVKIEKLENNNGNYMFFLDKLG